MTDDDDEREWMNVMKDSNMPDPSRCNGVYTLGIGSASVRTVSPTSYPVPHTHSALLSLVRILTFLLLLQVLFQNRYELLIGIFSLPIIELLLFLSSHPQNLRSQIDLFSTLT